MDIETYGFDEFLGALDDLQEGLETESVELLGKTGAHAEAEIKLRTPVDTGKLRKSITSDKVDTRDMSVWIGTPTHYAPHVEYGRRTGRSGFTTGAFMIRDGATVAQRRFYSEGMKMINNITGVF